MDVIPLDNYELWKQKLDNKAYTDVLREHEINEWNLLPFENKCVVLQTLLEKPINDYGIVYKWYFRNKWLEALLATEKKAPVRLLEIASGANDVIPRTLAVAFNHPDTTYTTANSNKELTKKFREITQDIPIQFKIIEDDARRMEEFVLDGDFDIVAHEHSVNDIIYDMLCRKKGLDTVNIPWFDLYSDIITLVNEECAKGTLETNVKDGLIGIFSSCINVLGKDSFIIINHFMNTYDLDRGINYDFWENLLPTFRKWMNEASIGQEVAFDGFDPQWWMFIKNVSIR